MSWLKLQWGKRKKIRRSIWITAIIVGVLGILIRIILVPPDELLKRLGAWWALVSGAVAWTNAVVLGVGFLLGYVILRLTWKPTPTAKVIDVSKIAAVIDSRKFEELFKQGIESKDYTSVKVFGYTGETVSDYFKFDHKYLQDIHLQILNRNWVAEKNDEVLHNQTISSFPVLRKWEKADGIKIRAQEVWNYLTKRDVKYYSTPPFVKAIILKGPNKQKAFVTFYEWEQVPKYGGSEFKGASLAMIHIPGESDLEREIISYLTSQFEYYWNNRSKSAEQILREETKPAENIGSRPTKR